MKKTMAVLLALMLAITLTVSASADGLLSNLMKSFSDTDTVYTSTTGLFTFRIPSGFTLMDEDFGSDLSEIVSDGSGAEELGMSEEDVATMQEILASVDISSLDYVINMKTGANFNAVAIPGGGLPQSQLANYAKMIDEMYAASYVQQGLISSEEDFQPRGIVTYGDNTFYAAHIANVFGVAAMSYDLLLTSNKNNDQLNFTFNNCTEDEIRTVLESIEFIY